MTADNGEHLFIPITTKLLASGTDDDGIIRQFCRVYCHIKEARILSSVIGTIPKSDSLPLSRFCLVTPL